MDRERKIILFILLSLFVIVIGLLAWSFIYDYQTRFLAGTSQPQKNVPEVSPTLPPMRPTDPAAGSKDPGALTIVEFADFSCLYCRITQGELSKALSATRTPVQLIWRDLPEAARPEGMNAALAGRCAGEQGKFWEMHDALFGAKSLNQDGIQQAAKSVVKDQTAWLRCFNDGKYLQNIRDDVALARQHNITSTPTLFVGKEVVSGYISAAELQTLIQQTR